MYYIKSKFIYKKANVNEPLDFVLYNVFKFIFVHNLSKTNLCITLEASLFIYKKANVNEPLHFVFEELIGGTEFENCR